MHTRYSPFSLLHHGLYCLDYPWVCLANIVTLSKVKEHASTPCSEDTYREVLERTSLLNIGKCSLELLQLNVYFLRRLLGFGDLLSFKYHRHNECRSDTRDPPTALVSNASIALMCALTSYVTGLKSLESFSASSTIAWFFRIDR